MAKSDILVVDDTALRYAGKVIPLHNIAYLERLKVAKQYAGWNVLFLILGVAAGFVSVQSRASPVIPVGAVLAVWLLVVLIIALSKRNYVLALQTNAGDAPRLFTTSNRALLDTLVDQLMLRLKGQALAPMTVNIKNETITAGGDVIFDGDKTTVHAGGSITGSFTKASPPDPRVAS